MLRCSSPLETLPSREQLPLLRRLRGARGVVCGAALLGEFSENPLVPHQWQNTHTHTHTRRNCPADPATGFTAERERGPRRAAGSCRLPLPTLPAGSREKVQETVRLVRILPLPWDRGTHEDKLSYKIRSLWLFETSVASGCAL